MDPIPSINQSQETKRGENTIRGDKRQRPCWLAYTTRSVTTDFPAYQKDYGQSTIIGGVDQKYTTAVCSSLRGGHEIEEEKAPQAVNISNNQPTYLPTNLPTTTTIKNPPSKKPS